MDVTAIPATVAHTYTTQEPVGILQPAQFGVPNHHYYQVWLLCKTNVLAPPYLNDQPPPLKEEWENKGLSTLRESTEDKPPPHYHSVPCVHELWRAGVRYYAIFSLFPRTETACTYRWIGGPGMPLGDPYQPSYGWIYCGRRADEEKPVPVVRSHNNDNNNNAASVRQDQPAPYVILLPRSEQAPLLLPSYIPSGEFRNLAVVNQHAERGIFPFYDSDPCFDPGCNMPLTVSHDRDSVVV